MINEDQIRVMIKFMERHGDLRLGGNRNNRMRIRKKWMELVAILNRIGDKKTLTQWTKVWSDTKYNAVKKYKKGMAGGPELTENEKTIINLLKSRQSQNQHTVTKFDDQNSHPEQSSTMNSFCENPVKVEIKNDNISNLEQPKTEQVFYLTPGAEQRRDSLYSLASSSDKRSSTDSTDKLSEIADKFYELEREREKMAHEREMARMQQHSEFISVMSRLVNVVESLAPSIKMYLDRNINGDG